MSNYAVIESGGKQYRIEAGEAVTTEIMPDVSVGDTITFDRVLMVKNGDAVETGTPYLEGRQISAEVEAVDRARKVTVFKYKPKKRYRVKRGHRQHYMISRIKEI